ncbi:hypothetical protein [Methanosarcina barkeri]|nr:hypothetical protein [Methanosarcina barkeri]
MYRQFSEKDENLFMAWKLGKEEKIRQDAGKNGILSQEKSLSGIA